jgi:hypothetical protein
LALWQKSAALYQRKRTSTLARGGNILWISSIHLAGLVTKEVVEQHGSDAKYINTSAHRHKQSGEALLWILFSRCAHEEVVQVSRDVETAAPLSKSHLIGILKTGTNQILLPTPPFALDIHW